VNRNYINGNTNGHNVLSKNGLIHGDSKTKYETFSRIVAMWWSFYQWVKRHISET